MAYAPRVGFRVRYRDAAGQVRPARVLSLGTGGKVTVRVGTMGNGSTVTDAAKQTGKGSTAGWVRGAR